MWVLVVAHGNGNCKSDDSEAQAIRTVFANKEVPVTGFKWSMGHTLCASGVLDAVMTTYALETNAYPVLLIFSNWRLPVKAYPSALTIKPWTIIHVL